MKKLIILLLLTVLVLPVYSEEVTKKESTFDFYTELAKPTEKYTEEGAVDDSEAQAYGRELRKAYWDRVHRGEFAPSKASYVHYVEIPLFRFIHKGIRTSPDSL